MNTTPTADRKIIIPVAWTLILLGSSLPDILYYEWTGNVTGWLVWAKLGILAAFLVLCYFWKAIRSLWQLAIVLGMFYLAGMFKLAIWDATWFKNRMAAQLQTFTSGQALWETVDLAAAMLILAVVWALKRQPRNFYLSRGDINAQVEPVRWLGVKKGTSIRKFGLIFLLIACAALLSILIPGAKISVDSLNSLLPILPAVLLIAALNSLGEEISFRISLLSTSIESVGRDQAVWLAAVFFGLAHFIGGQPGGIPGVLITTFLGWGFGKCMTESKTMLFPWFMHFVMNTIIFFFNALGAVL